MLLDPKVFNHLTFFCLITLFYKNLFDVIFVKIFETFNFVIFNHKKTQKSTK